MIENLFIYILFITYIALWRYRRRSIKKVTGIDPEVFVEASSPLQKYFVKFIKFITIILVILIIPHSLGIQYYSMFSHFPPLDYFQADLIGFVIGLFGLAICAIAKEQWLIHGELASMKSIKLN